MNTEVVAIGTELLLGPSVDTNSTWIGERLAEAGIDSFLHTVVGDNLGRIVQTLRDALDRADAVIVTGGLGPTQDDITRAAVAEVMGAPLFLDKDMEANIEKMFADRGRSMPETNRLQAWRPEGSTVIVQNGGTAPGLICPVGEKVVCCVPGVPWEMKDMLERAVIPELLRRGGSSGVIRSRVLRTWGSGEAAVAETVNPRLVELDADPNAQTTIAFLAKGIEGIYVRVTAKAEDVAAATLLLDKEERILRDLLGEQIFGVDDETMEFAVGELLKQRGAKLAVAESMTGGLIAKRITDTPGASAWFEGGVVSYASEVKYDLLGVPVGPVVSEEAARAMAEGVARLLNVDVAISITGVAGPDEQEGQPVGTVFAGIAIAGEPTKVVAMRMPGGKREHIRNLACINVLNELKNSLIS